MTASTYASNLPSRSTVFNGEPDYKFWRSKEVWLLPDSAKLLCGRDPMSKYPGRPIYNKSLKVIDIIDNAFEATRTGKLLVKREALLPNHILIAPKDFLFWASSEGLEIPGPLEELCSREPAIESKLSHEILKERIQTVARTIWFENPSTTQADMIKHKAMSMIIGEDHIPENVIEKWICKLAPNS